MTKKQKELLAALPFFKGKEVQVWTSVQMNSPKKQEPFFEGTLHDCHSAGQYVQFKNVTLHNGKFYADYDINSGIIARIIQKPNK